MPQLELPHLRTEPQSLLIIPSFAPHPIELHREFASHSYRGDRSPATHRQAEEPASPLWFITHDRVRRFDQQATQQRVALLSDVSEVLAATRGFFAWDEPQIAAYLLATSQAVGSSKDEHKGQRRGWHEPD